MLLKILPVLTLLLCFPSLAIAQGTENLPSTYIPLEFEKNKDSYALAFPARYKNERRSIDPNQFYVVQFTNEGGIELPSSIIPTLNDAKNPDVRLNLNMEVANIPNVTDKKSEANLRISIGNDKSNSPDFGQELFWFVTAAMDLWDEEKKQKADKKNTASQLSDAFKASPIIIPGGIANLNIDVIQIEPDSGWKRFVRFFTGSGGSLLTTQLGLPAITQSAVTLIDELIDKTIPKNSTVLLQGNPVKLALTKQAYDFVSNGGGNTQAGGLTNGRWLFIKGSDYNKFSEQSLVYNWNYGVIHPTSIDIEDIISGDKENPIDSYPYVVIYARMNLVNWKEYLRG